MCVKILPKILSKSAFSRTRASRRVSVPFTVLTLRMQFEKVSVLGCCDDPLFWPVLSSRKLCVSEIEGKMHKAEETDDGKLGDS